MKRIIILIVLAFATLGVNAQNKNNVKPFEFELGIGVNKGGNVYGAAAEIGLQFFVEARYNVANSPFDIGLQVMIGSLSRNEDIYGIEHHIRYRGMMTTFVDYNFRKWKRIAPFVGLGVGMAAVDNDCYWNSSEIGRRISEVYRDRSFILNPRIGVELFNHVRVTFEYKLMTKEYSFFGLNLGVVFGGGYKK